MDRYRDKIGCFVHIPNVGRGQLKYIGPVDTKPGIYVGVDLLANIGKNDGSFRSKRYFNTEYPQSGLFIQLPKIASLLDSAQPGQPVASRRSTMAPEVVLDSVPRVRHRVSSSESSESTVVRRQISSDPLSPTPVGIAGVAENGSLPRLRKQRDVLELEGSVEHERDIDMVPSSVPSRRTGPEDSTSRLLKEYEHRIERQDREILQFKRLLDDQRMVLEEIQPTIDQYESSLREMENEMDSLRRRLKTEREQQQKQKQFFETEHEQLLAVVEELHEEIKANEERVIMAQSNHSNGPESVPQLKKTISELMERVNFLEAAQMKWHKEKEQLQLQNESLSKEYRSLSSAYLRAQENSNADADSDTQTLQEKLYNANVKIAQLEDLLQQQRHMRSPTYQHDTDIHNYRSDTVDSLPLSRSKTKIEATAGKEAWCALCERDGHQSIECPNELPLASDRQNDLRSPSKDQLLF